MSDPVTASPSMSPLTDLRIQAAEIQIGAARATNCSSRNLAIAALAAADAVDPLRQSGHRVEISKFTWTLQHPAECRPDLLSCPVTKALSQSGVSGVDDGVWGVELDGDKKLNFAREAAT